MTQAGDEAAEYAFETSKTIQASTVIRNIGQLVTIAEKPISGATGPLQILEKAALAIHNGRIAWIGADSDTETLFQQDNNAEMDGITLVDAQGAVVTPGFVDSHTHLVFAGDRSEEFHLRCSGVGYGELLARGRGILTTMQATRNADAKTLMDLAGTHLDAMRVHGATTVEVKTGYGLDFRTEESCLRIINELQTREQDSVMTRLDTMRVIPTFLGAHSIPPEYRERRNDYIELLLAEMLPRFVGLARFCDVFCEREAFTLEESRRILLRAQELGYALKLHADQLSASGGARLAAEVGAVSADHLDYASDDDLDAMRQAGVVATLLPGCSYTLRSPYPSARRYLDHGLTVALATDFNPGTSYCENMQMIVGLAMSSMGMSLEDALIAATLNGAKALAMQDECGSIEVGKRCELALWSVQDYHEIGYHFGTNLVKSTLVIR